MHVTTATRYLVTLLSYVHSISSPNFLVHMVDTPKATEQCVAMIKCRVLHLYLSFCKRNLLKKKKVLEQLLINYIIRVGGWVCRHIISICQLYCEIHCNRADHRKFAPFSTAAGTLPWHCGAVEMWPGMGNACGHTKDTGNPNTIARCSALERFYDCGCHGIRVRDYCACSHNWWGICKDSIYHI